MIKPKKLRDPTLKQKKFTKEYVKSGNATQAAIKAGYSKKTAQQIGSENLLKPVVQAEIQSVADELGIHAKYVLTTIRDTIERCSQAKPVLDKKGEQVYTENIEGDVVPAYIFDSRGVLKGAEMLGKHLKLFTDKIELEAKVETDARTPEAELELARQLVAILSDPTLKK